MAKRIIRSMGLEYQAPPSPLVPKIPLVYINSKTHIDIEDFRELIKKLEKEYDLKKGGWPSLRIGMSTAISERPVNLESRSKIRKGNLKRRLDKKHPLFSCDLYKQELNNDPNYYNATREIDHELKDIRTENMKDFDNMWEALSVTDPVIEINDKAWKWINKYIIPGRNI